MVEVFFFLHGTRRNQPEKCVDEGIDCGRIMLGLSGRAARVGLKHGEARKYAMNTTTAR